MSDTNRKVHKIEIDRDVCIGAATCLIIAPKAFQLNKDGVAEVLASHTEHTDEDLIQAARSCPTQAIKLLDENGNTI